MSQKNNHFPPIILVLSILGAFLFIGGLYQCHTDRVISDDDQCHENVGPSKSFDDDQIQRIQQIQHGLGEVAEHANKLGDWALAIFAGSVAVLIGTSYLQPQQPIVRIMYLLFIPGWGFMGLSLYSAKEVSQGYLASLLMGEEFIEETASCLNDAYARQLDYLEMATVFFSLWLVIFLFWWIFFAKPPVGSKHRT